MLVLEFVGLNFSGTLHPANTEGNLSYYLDYTKAHISLGHEAQLNFSGL